MTQAAPADTKATDGIEDMAVTLRRLCAEVALAGRIATQARDAAIGAEIAAKRAQEAAEG